MKHPMMYEGTLLQRDCNTGVLLCQYFRKPRESCYARYDIQNPPVCCSAMEWKHGRESLSFCFDIYTHEASAKRSQRDSQYHSTGPFNWPVHAQGTEPSIFSQWINAGNQLCVNIIELVLIGAPFSSLNLHLWTSE